MGTGDEETIEVSVGANEARREAEAQERDRSAAVRRVLVVEGSFNLVALILKLIAGLLTGSITLISDALHSFTDVANNVVAFLVMRAAAEPPDREHPYGHRKFETLAVFVLAVLLTFIGFEIVMHAVREVEHTVVDHPAALPLILTVLVLNTLVAIWQERCARRLDSEILRADARHTASDILTTIVAFAGWKLAAAGHAWADSLLAVLIALFVFFLAFGLFRRVVPVLVDRMAFDPDDLRQAVERVDGVEEVRGVRSRWMGSIASVDVVVGVEESLPLADAHEIADRIEDALKNDFSAQDVTVHLEPTRLDDS